MKIYFSIVLLLAAQLLFADKSMIKFDRDDRNYNTGDEIIAEITISDVQNKELLSSGKYVVAFEGKRFNFDLANGNPFKCTLKITQADPGFPRLVLKRINQDGKDADINIQSYWVSPDKLQMGFDMPSDFMEFWKSELDKANKTPLDVKMEPLPQYTKEGH